MTEIEFKKQEINDTPLKIREISPLDRLTFANKLMIGLFICFLVSVLFIGYYTNDYGKFVFTSTQQIITSFGSFIMGFYFSKGK